MHLSLKNYPIETILQNIGEHLGPSFLCQQQMTDRQWMAFPLKERPGYLSLRGSVFYQALGKATREFAELKTMEYCQGNLDTALTRSRERGYDVLETFTLPHALKKGYVLEAQMREFPEILQEIFRIVNFPVPVDGIQVANELVPWN